ncbi:DUF72 domain-containing protein [Dyella flagellata]|uniref:DUF72 domain-containing protein n=1 Tax=Dyella flagellata TaxID=1867833 RepID=A0ABQ5X7M0_9GAMM|nr:DUF72 domain-containing protein [Dyella flagellata]GLQ87573.1 hypothetical protein GCM10007898_11390 [Dyella flagellata]
MALFDEPPCPVNGIRVGVGGWTFVPWRNNFYPKGLVQRRELEYASRKLTAIEINGTYYGTQKPATYAKWAAETPPGFMFSAKAPMRIMQARSLEKTGPQIEDFLGGIASLGDRLGPIVWQFDANQRLQRESFGQFLDLLPKQIEGCALRHVLDVRDRDFVNTDYLALVRKHGMATVFTDSPDYPSFADVTANFVYARLMRSRSNVATGYSGEELDGWAKRAHAWADGEQPAELPYLDTGRAPQLKRDVFVFFISAAKEYNPAAAMALIERLRG